MKHTLEELQFAAVMRELVAKRKQEIARNMTDKEFAAFDCKPIDPLIQDLLKELDGIATVIRQHAKKDQ